MQKHHNITIKRHPGATMIDIVEYVKPVIRKKPDCLIIHAGTNDLTNKEGVNTIENLRMINKTNKASLARNNCGSFFCCDKERQAGVAIEGECPKLE